MNSLETIDYKGFKINIYQDEEPENPREWSNIGIMVCFHKRYILGDKHNLVKSNFEDWNDLHDYLTKSGAIIILPLRLYDHSGIAMSVGSNYPFNDPWDSCQVGFIYTTLEKLHNEFGRVESLTETDKKFITESLISEVETYDQYLRGDVYGFTITKESKCDKCGNDTSDAVGSLWGIFGYENAVKEAKEIIDNLGE